MSIYQEKTDSLFVNVPVNLNQHLKIICEEDNVSINSFVIRAIEREFDEREEMIDAAEFDIGMKELAEGRGEPIESVIKELGL